MHWLLETDAGALSVCMGGMQVWLASGKANRNGMNLGCGR